MRIGMAVIAVLVIALPTATMVSARTWYIRPDGYGEAGTIQAGINAAAGGDSVLLAAGTYTGVGNRDIDFLGKAITVTSESGRDVTIIDCQGLGGGFYFHSGEGASSVLSGVTVRNVSGGIYGFGAICCDYDSSPTISNNTISGNSGDGIVCLGDPTISYNMISGNSGDGIYCSGSPAISHNTISDNSGHGIWCYDFSYVTVRHTTISGNFGGISCVLWSNAYVVATIISFSSSQEEAVFCDNSGATLLCCDVYGNAGGDWVGSITPQFGTWGNFSEDPKFCDRNTGNFTLCVNSPCAPGNHPQGIECGLIGALGVGCGPTAVEYTTWGRIKSMFR